MAQCVQCGGLPQPFSSHMERGDWVGQHRVHTGHAVRMWLEAM